MAKNTTIDVRVPAEVLAEMHRHPWPQVRADVLGVRRRGASTAESWPRTFDSAGGFVLMRISVPIEHRHALRAVADARGASLATALRDALLTRCGIDPATVPVAQHAAFGRPADRDEPQRPDISEVSLGAADAVTVRPRLHPQRFDAFIAEDRDSRWPYPSAARTAAATSPPQVSGTAP